MKLAILGAGNIGAALGKRWIAAGHEVCFGVRDPHSYTVEILMNSIDSDHARTDTLSKAAGFGDVVVLAVPWTTVPEVLSHTDGLAGKILVDCTNPMTHTFASGAASGAEEIARMLPGARVVKAFNTLGAENVAELGSGMQNAATFICGDDESAKEVVTQLGEDLGFEVIDVGPLSTANLIESLAQLWIQVSRRQGRGFGFGIMRRDVLV